MRGGRRGFTSTLFCMPPGYLAFYGRMTQRVAGCNEVLPDLPGIAPLLLRFPEIPFKDAMDQPSDLRRDDAGGSVNLAVTGYDLFDRAVPNGLGAEDILPDGVIRDTHFTGCLAIRSRLLI
jgi:hypothetical protein